MGLKSYLVKKLRKEVVRPVYIPVYSGAHLEGRRAVIAGGSGGIGFAIAQAFVKNGASVILLGTNEQRLENAERTLGDQCRTMVFDLTDFDAYQVKIPALLSLFCDDKKVDILVNAAGAMGKSDFLDIRPSDWDGVMDINLKAMYFLSQAFARYMIENGVQGNILNVSSTSALKPGWNPYCISKAGVASLTKGLADELAKYGIVVNAVAPGPVATRMLSADSDNLYNPRYQAKRYAAPEEIGNWAVYLVSDAGRLVLGDSLYISGGSGVLDICKKHNFG